MKLERSTRARSRMGMRFSLLLAAAAGCGGGRIAQPLPASASAPTPAPVPVGMGGMGGGTTGAMGGMAGEAPPAKANITWKALNREERIQYMRDVITPRMGELFRTFDAKAFARFDCSTCHGESAGVGTYTMPNPALATLPGNAPGFQALVRAKPEWMRFMGRQVRPQMAALLGLDEVDMRNPKPDQFGCRNCHPMPR